MRLVLLRHGYTAANLSHRYCGSTDLPLDGGALDAFSRARAGLLYPDVTGFRVLTSGLRRTEETLSAVYGPLPHGVEPAFREMDFGIFENKSYEELKQDPRYLRWIQGDNEKNRCPGGESGAEMQQRVLAALAGLTEDTLLVTHGGVIAAIMAHLFPGEEKNRYQWQPQPFCGYAVEPGRGYRPIPAEKASPF